MPRVQVDAGVRTSSEKAEWPGCGGRGRPSVGKPTGMEQGGGHEIEALCPLAIPASHPKPAPLPKGPSASAEPFRLLP
jgi:hypothetical protein